MRDWGEGERRVKGFNSWTAIKGSGGDVKTHTEHKNPRHGELPPPPVGHGIFSHIQSSAKVTRGEGLCEGVVEAIYWNRLIDRALINIIANLKPTM